MFAPVATAGGFGESRELFAREPTRYVLAPDAGPKLASLLLVALVLLWMWDRFRSLGPR